MHRENFTFYVQSHIQISHSPSLKLQLLCKEFVGKTRFNTAVTPTLTKVKRSACRLLIVAMAASQ